MNKNIFKEIPFEILKPSKIKSNKEGIVTGIIQEESCSKSVDNTSNQFSDKTTIIILVIFVVLTLLTMLKK